MLGPTDLAVRWFDEVWNKNREAAIDELAAPDVVFHSLRGGFRGTDAFKEFHRALNGILSDMHFEIIHAIGGGEYQSVYCTVTAVQRSTGKQVKFSGGGIGRVENGRLTEAWDAWDFLHLAEQLGQIESRCFEKMLTPPA